MLRESYAAGRSAAFTKHALEPATQVDSFVARTESGKSVPPDPSTDRREDSPGPTDENPLVFPGDPASPEGQPKGSFPTKTAVSGSLYANALADAARRSGGRVAPQILGQLGAAPRARLTPFLGQMARAPGTLQPTPAQAQAQAIMERVPWAGTEHGGAAAEAMPRYDQVLRGAGRLYQAPGLGRRILEAFGPATGHDPAYAPTVRASTLEATRAATPIGRRKAASDLGQLARHVMPYAIGAGIPLATAGAIALRKPELRANLNDLFARSGTVKEKDKAAPIPEPAMNMASQIGQALAERGLDPRTLRIAVDAPPGTGKTTLSRALAHQLGVKHYGLDWLAGNRWKRFLGGSHIESMPRAPRAGEILEHYNLLRSYDPELFDVAVHMRKDPEQVRQQLIQRGRSAGAAAILDYNKANRVGDLAFDTLGGDAIDLGNGVVMKLRPREGWGADRLDEQLRSVGVAPAGLTRHEKLLSLSEGKKTTGAGWRPYFKSPLSSGEAAVALGSIPLGVGAALAARRLLG
jgi:hypothetical protein